MTSVQSWRACLTAMAPVTMILTLSLSTFTALAAERAGTTLEAQQEAYQAASLGGRELEEGSAIFSNATVSTGRFGSLILGMNDESRLTLGPNSEVVIDEFVYDPDQSVGAAAIQLGKGVLRMISGRLPSGQVQIRTPIGNVGIRGTDFTLEAQDGGRLRVWLIQGAITLAPSQSNQTFDLDAPAFAVCSATNCEIGGSATQPITFPPPRGFSSSGSASDGDGDDPNDSGD